MSTPIKILALAFSLQPLAFALGPADLEARLASGAKLTIIDVRAPAFYEKGHIPGAISIPAALCASKKLPPLGDVVVYDAGLGNDEAKTAAAALNAKPGLKADVLEGGFAAWTEAKGQSTQAAGVKSEEIPSISYGQLQAVQSNGVVIVDLRKPPLQSRQNAQAAPPPLTDLRKEFPGAAVATSPFSLPQTRQSGSGASPLMVLIDSGDGSAQAMASTLKANGIARFVVLAGGEAILSRHGEPGLQRLGSGATVFPPGLVPVPATK